MKQKTALIFTQQKLNWRLPQLFLVFGLILLLGLIPHPASATPGDVERVSVNNSSVKGNGQSYASAISSDGNYVAFVSFATNLVNGDANGVSDIFVSDRLNGVTTRVSVASDGSQANSASFSPAISGDGRYVAFASDATNLVSGDTNGLKDVFIYDRQTGTTTRVSVDSSSAQTDGISDGPALSADGRYVAFWSEATNLIDNDTNNYIDVFVHDQQTGATSRVSVSSAGAQVIGASVDPSISSDGRYVAFASQASSLVNGDTNSSQDVFVHDRQTGMTTRVSVDSSGAEANGASDSKVSLSNDGRYITFESDATNLVSGDTNGATDIFLRDLQTGTTTVVSVAGNDAVGDHRSLNPTMSSDGRYIAFESLATNLVSGDTNGASDIFLYDRQLGSTTRVSVYSNGGQTTNGSLAPALSGNAQFVSFYSADAGLVGETFNGITDVYVVTLGSTNSTPVAADDSYSTNNDTSLTVAAPGVLSNDSDADGDALMAVEVSAPNNGTLTLNNDGSFSYTPNAGFTGSDSFTYVANDGSENSNVATVTLTVALACPAFPITVSDEASLNWAITCYNALTTPGSYTVNLGADINLTASTTPINNAITGVELLINGAGYRVDGQAIAGVRPVEIATDSDVTMQDLTITGGNIVGNNSSGGGILNSGSLTLNNSTVSGNTVSQQGGGIRNLGTLTLSNNTVSGNAAGYDGGGIFNNGTLTLSNSTISGNSSGTNGGGIFNIFTGIITLRNSTVADNSAATNAGGIFNYLGSVTMTNAIIASNSSGGNCSGAITDGGHNLDDGTSCGFAAANNSLSNAAANLGPLQDNGGPTATHALLSGSAAIDAGDNATCAAAPVNGLDQRSITRPQGTTCDMGAFELEMTATAFATCGGYDIFETAPGVYAAPSFSGNLVVGTDGPDWLRGTDGPDLILGLGGPDDLWGKGGDDVICGGAGMDIILGMSGNDTLYGDDQPDWLIGGPDNDVLYGGDGWDDLQGDGGNDILYGEGGSNVLLGGASDDDLFGGDEPDALFGQDGNDDLDGAGADDYCKGGRDNDTITNCEGASAANTDADDEAVIDEEAARRSNDGINGENAIEQRIQQLFLPLVTKND